MALQTVKTTCLFCMTLILPRVSNEQECFQKYELVTHLCVKMALDVTEIPAVRECTEKRFPFCRTCTELLHDLWRLKDKSDSKSQATVKNILRRIQTRVDIGEPLLTGGSANCYLATVRRKNPSLAINERLKFMTLRAMIRSAQVLLSSPVQSSARQSGLDSSRPGPSPTAAGSSGRSRAPLRSVNLPGPSRAAAIVADKPRPSQAAAIAADQPGPSRAAAMVADQPRPSRAAVTAADQPGPSRAVVTAANERRLDVSRSLSQPRQKRDLFIHGVQVLECTSAFLGEYLKCGVCNHTIPVPPKSRYGPRESTPKFKMTEHIAQAHKEQPPARRTYECSRCFEEFPTMSMLTEHKKEHSADKQTTCEICARTINCSRNQMPFLIHQYTHKNDEQRKAAHAAGELGAFNGFLDPSNKRRRVRGSKSPMARPGKRNRR